MMNINQKSAWQQNACTQRSILWHGNAVSCRTYCNRRHKGFYALQITHTHIQPCIKANSSLATITTGINVTRNAVWRNFCNSLLWVCILLILVSTWMFLLLYVWCMFYRFISLWLYYCVCCLTGVINERIHFAPANCECSEGIKLKKNYRNYTVQICTNTNMTE